MHCAVDLHWDDEISVANGLRERNKHKTDELWPSLRWETNVEEVIQLNPPKPKSDTISEISFQ